MRQNVPAHKRPPVVPAGASACGCCFRPNCARSCYCSDKCRGEARRWTLWKAQQRYRSTENGRAHRREQSRRRRQRQEEQPQKVPQDPIEKGCEGHHQRRRGKIGRNFSCDRPGCYECFNRSARCSWQRFCSALCRHALRLVRLREKRWQGGCSSCPLKLVISGVSAVRGP